MDLTSYLLGKKKGGGGVTPTGTINITSNGETNVTNYATANVNVQPDLESKSITITENTTTTLTPTQGKDGMSSVSITTNVSGGSKVILPDGIKFRVSSCSNMDWLLYMDISQITDGNGMFNSCPNLATFPLVDTSNITNMSMMFQFCTSLQSIPQINTSSSTDFSGIFSGCTALIDVPVLNMSQVTRKQEITNMFSGCSSLSNNSLNNVLASLNTIVASITSSYRTLKQVGLSSEQATICTTLSNWQVLVDKGWTTGY